VYSSIENPWSRVSPLAGAVPNPSQIITPVWVGGLGVGVGLRLGNQGSKNLAQGLL